MKLVVDNHSIRMRGHKSMLDFMDVSFLLYGNVLNDLEIQACKNKSGVYVISILDEYYKIGSSKNIYKRLLGIERSLPFEINLEKIFETIAYKPLENILHLRFKHKKIKTEWFRLTHQDIEDMEDILSEFNI